MIIKNSKPFSNGTEYEIFKENWCERCAHCKYRDYGFLESPEHGGCKLLDAMENARFDISEWPETGIVEERYDDGNIKFWHKCTNFTER